MADQMKEDQARMIREAIDPEGERQHQAFSKRFRSLMSEPTIRGYSPKAPEPDLTEVEAQNLFTWSDGSPEFVRVETWIGEDKGIGAPHHVRLVLPDGSGFMLSKLEMKELCKMLMGAVRS